MLNVPKSSLAMSVNSTKGACVSQLPSPSAICSDVILRCTLRMCTDRTDRTNRNALCPDVGVCEPLRSPISVITKGKYVRLPTHICKQKQCILRS